MQMKSPTIPARRTGFAHDTQYKGIDTNGGRLLRDRISALARRTLLSPHRPHTELADSKNASRVLRFRAGWLACTAAACLTACASFLPTSGPSKAEIDRARTTAEAASIQILDINESVTRQLLARRASHLFSESLSNTRSAPRTLGPGDMLEVSIWEASPATLFSATDQLNAAAGMLGGGKGVIPTSHATTLPEEEIDDDGCIFVPFAGRIQAGGKTLQAVEADIAGRLAKKANQPEVLVRLTRDASSSATVVGEVNTSTRVPLLPGSEKLLDALASAGGVRQPVNKTTIQITRAQNVYSLPLETIIRDPQQNVLLQPGDVITALFQPYSFIALGATGKTDEINFETQGISLAQALARAGGLIDSRSDAQAVFIFRFESKDALSAWPRQPLKTTLDGQVPAIFRLDLSDPRSFFLMQSFPVQNRDVLYVSNAPSNEVQKFLNILFTVAYPILTAVQVGAL
jgi:polysaccharide export outer membrane protein